jgi:hypothetical protein
MADKIPQTQVEYTPVCPHCEKEIREVHWRQMKTALHLEYLFTCPHCRKVLGVGVGVH